MVRRRLTSLSRLSPSLDSVRSRLRGLQRLFGELGRRRRGFRLLIRRVRLF
jgi:hypothetical protein